MKFNTIIIAMSLMIAAPFAEARRDQNREARQEARIAQGVESGQLTAREARRLQHGQKRIEHAQQQAMADGVMTDKEAAHLERMQDRQSRRIYHQKHDAQTREPSHQEQ